jgi:hypothetical protein
MKRTWVKIVVLALALSLLGAGMAFAAKAKKAAKEFDTTKALIDSYTLIEAKKYPQAQKLLDKVRHGGREEVR